MTTEPFTVDLFVRSLSPVGARGRPAETIERLGSLTEVGTIDDYSVTVWGRDVELSSETAIEERESLVLDRVATLRSWAVERGVALDAFERREVSTPTGETHTVLTLPVMVLVESVGANPPVLRPVRPTAASSPSMNGSNRSKSAARIPDSTRIGDPRGRVAGSGCRSTIPRPRSAGGSHGKPGPSGPSPPPRRSSHLVGTLQNPPRPDAPR